MTDENRNETESLTETTTPDTVPAQTAVPAAIQESPATELMSSPEDPEKAAWLQVHAPTLAKWLAVLFWLSIAGIFCNLAQNTLRLPDIFPATGVVLSIVTYLISLRQILAAWQLRKTDSKFRTLAFFNAALLAISVIAQVAFGGAKLSVTAFGYARETDTVGLLVIAMAIVSAFTIYLEITALRNVTRYVDEVLSGKWHKLCAWSIGLLVTSLVSGMVPLVAPMSISAIGAAICAIIRMVYLHRTAKLFKASAQNEDTIEEDAK